MFTTMLLALLLTEQAVDPHVRTSDARIRSLIIKATDRSPTFRSLITQLNESDVIVYVEPRLTQRSLRGYLLHRVFTQGAHRSVRLVINPHGRDELVIQVIAHELQHALEIARAPEVGRSETVQDLFVRIGSGSACPRSDCYETKEAIQVDAAVAEELKSNR